MFKVADVKEMSDYASECLLCGYALSLHIMTTKAAVDPTAPQFAEHGRKLFTRLRHNIYSWDNSPKNDIRAALAPIDSAHRAVATFARNLALQIHTDAAAVPDASNHNYARVHREIPARWSQICNAVPEGLLLVNEATYNEKKSGIESGLSDVLRSIYDQLVLKARNRFNQGDELSPAKIKEVCLLAEEALSLTGKYEIPTEPALTLLNDVAAAYG